MAKGHRSKIKREKRTEGYTSFSKALYGQSISTEGLLRT